VQNPAPDKKLLLFYFAPFLQSLLVVLASHQRHLSFAMKYLPGSVTLQMTMHEAAAAAFEGGNVNTRRSKSTYQRT
jgi:hypothetical protein